MGWVVLRAAQPRVYAAAALLSGDEYQGRADRRDGREHRPGQIHRDALRRPDEMPRIQNGLASASAKAKNVSGVLFDDMRELMAHCPLIVNRRSLQNL